MKEDNFWRNQYENKLDELNKLYKENELLREEIHKLREAIIDLYDGMNSLAIIEDHELNDIEEI